MSRMITCTRRLEFDSGHRVMRHESKCRNVHGHRYAAEITVMAPALDLCGRVVDFGVVKKLIGGWIDKVLDHGYIHHPDDTIGDDLRKAGLKTFEMPTHLGEPTAENIAALIAMICGATLEAPLEVIAVRIYETPNCWADWHAQSL